MLSFLGVFAGIALLVAGGTGLVRGASQIATAAGVSPMMVGLTIVGFGTSSPELVISVVGVLSGASDIVFGNAVGSNISNLGLVLGAAALFSPIAIKGAIVRRELPLLLLATTVITVMVLDTPLEGRPPAIGRIDSIVLFTLFGIFIYITVLDLVRVKRADPLLTTISASPAVAAARHLKYPWLHVGAGLALLYFGGRMTIDNGIELAETLGWSPTVVGLFVVAVGTSLPELVTSVIAAVRRESDLALGNVIGSNLFNSLMVLPAGGVLTHIPVPEGGVVDLAFSWLLAAAVILAFFLGRAVLGRWSGVLLLLSYFGYALARIF